MSPTLYLIHMSPAVRAVLITAKAIGLTLNEKEINLFDGENLTPEYLKLNPLHTVPTLVDDNGFAIWDSHAISTYLVSKYAKDDSLYPKDLKKRAIVDQRLHFESGVVFARLIPITRPIILEGRTSIYQKDRDNMIDAYSQFESILEGETFAAGDFVSVADYSLFATIKSISALVPVDSQKFPRVTAWLKRVEALPETVVNQRGNDEYLALLNGRLTKESL